MPSTTIELRKVTKDNIGRVMALKVRPEQTDFVAINSRSLAEAYVQRDNAWPRAIYVGADPVGFVMLFLADSDNPGAIDGRATYCLWRFMIDAQYQGKGYGTASMEAVINYVKTLPDAQALYLSYVPGDGCPEPFYTKLGFVHTGKVEGGEVEMKLVLI